MTKRSTIFVCVCTICIRRYRKVAMNLAENQSQTIVCLSRKQCLQVYLSHRNGEKCWLWAYLSADAAILPLPALWCFDCTDMNAARTEEILCWASSYLFCFPRLLFVHPSKDMLTSWYINDFLPSRFPEGIFQCVIDPLSAFSECQFGHIYKLRMFN